MLGLIISFLYSILTFKKLVENNWCCLFKFVFSCYSSFPQCALECISDKQVQTIMENKI